MAHGQRYMQQVAPNQWMIRCKVCGRHGARKFTSPRECHDWWRDHVSTAKHQQTVERRPQAVKQRQETERFWQAIGQVIVE